MTVAAAIVALIALVSAIACAALAMFHAFGMIRGIRASSEWWVNLIPFIAFAFPAALDASGLVHRAKFVRWLMLAVALALVAALLQLSLGSQA
jgi:hypothetical protein